MERDAFFLTCFVSKTLFPRLDRDQRQKRMVIVAGTLFFGLLVAALDYFLIIKLNSKR